MRVRTVALLTAPLVAVVLLSWVARAVFTDGSSAESSPANTPTGECAGLPLADARPLQWADGVTAMTVCTSGAAVRPGDGWWTTREEWTLPPDLIEQAAPTLMISEEITDSCYLPASSVLAGGSDAEVVVTMRNGTRFVVDLEQDRCGAGRRAVRALVDQAVGITPVVTWLARTATEEQVRDACAGTAPLTPTPAASSWPGLPESPLLVCRQDAEPAAGSASPALARTLFSSMTSEPPGGCGPAARVDRFVTVRTAPPTSIPLFSAKTDGCHVVVDAGWATLGYADPGLVDRLLADG